MKAFEHTNARSVEEAIALLRGKANARAIAGGTDMYGMMKDELIKIDRLVNLKTISGLSYIKEESGTIKIGAMTTLRQMEDSELLRTKVPLLAQAAFAVASPQIRNVGTLGGNLCQSVRCWYFRQALCESCYKRGGNYCYAVPGNAEYNAILGGAMCFAVHPSDTAVALLALGASLRIAGPGGQRTVVIDRFFTDTTVDVLRENILLPGELVTEVSFPIPDRATKGVFLKVAPRRSFDFAQSVVAVVAKMENGNVKAARVALGGVASTPIRSPEAEDALTSRSVPARVAPLVAAAAVAGARPMRFNSYKIDLTKNLVERAVLALS